MYIHNLTWQKRKGEIRSWKHLLLHMSLWMALFTQIHWYDANNPIWIEWFVNVTVHYICTDKATCKRLCYCLIYFRMNVWPCNFIDNLIFGNLHILQRRVSLLFILQSIHPQHTIYLPVYFIAFYSIYLADPFIRMPHNTRTTLRWSVRLTRLYYLSWKRNVRRTYDMHLCVYLIYGQCKNKSEPETM